MRQWGCGAVGQCSIVVIASWPHGRSKVSPSMQSHPVFRSLACVAVVALATVGSMTAIQEQAPAGGGRGRQSIPPPGGQGRGTFPQFRRALADPAVLARGKGVYESNCAACHGIDLRGGQQGGPNLLRSQLVLSDQNGEAITPVVQSGRPNPPPGAPPMPAFPLAPDAIHAIAEYIHSVLAEAGRQGRPPGAGQEVPAEKILVGNAAAGQAYFAANCSSCHSVTGDLKGFATRAADARDLQNRWVSGGAGRGRGAGRGAAPSDQTPPITVVVTPASGPRLEGRLVRMDDFTVTLVQTGGTRRTVRRASASDPKIEVHDPMDAHHRFATTLSDKDMHDVTAYLSTLR